MTAISIGLSVAGNVAGFAGQQQQTDAYNAAAQQNAINAGSAATRKYSDEQRRISQEAKQTNQEGWDAVMKARQAKGTAVASAGTAGMDLSSLSVNSILSNIAFNEANSEYNIADRHDQEEAGYRSNVEAYKAEAQGRINSMPFKEGPSPLGLALGIATDAFGIAAKNPKFANAVNGAFGSKG